VKRSSLHLERKQGFWESAAYGLLLGVFIGFLITVTIFILARNKFQYIDKVHVVSNTIVSDEEVIGVVKEVLGSSCFIHASCHSRIWFPVYFAEKYISTRLPRIEEAHITFTDDGMIVQVTERVLFARFCMDRSNDYCYAVDSAGLMYSRLPKVSSLRYIPTFRMDADRVRVDLEGQILPLQLWGTSDVSAFQSLVSLVNEFGRVYTIEIGNRDVNVEIDRLYDYSLVQDTAVLKFNRESLNHPDTLAYIRASLDRLKSFKSFTEKFTVYPLSLEYLDFRFDKRLYMRFTDWNTEEELETEDKTL
jgi:hypothetical protein